MYTVSMNEDTRHKLEARRNALIEQLHQLPNFMRGTVYVRDRKCGRASCVCAKDGPKHSTRQLVVHLKGKTQTRYVRTGEMERVQGLIAVYEQLWQIVNQLTEVNLELLRGEHPGGPRNRKSKRA
jgi:hypothetical protein